MDINVLTPRLFLLIAAGGLLGTFARYGVQLAIQGHGERFPAGTMVVNIAGSFLFGFVVRFLAAGELLAVQMRIALTVGFCGAFTTMSSFNYEMLTLVETGKYLPAATYFLGSLAGGLVAMGAGVLLAQSLR